MNSSISITLNGNEKSGFATVTSVLLSKKLRNDALYIDGIKKSVTDKGVDAVIKELRRISGNTSNILVVSKNLFPSDAGIASSASGIATMTYAAAQAFELDLSLKELSIIARLGSGSASRSMFGGFVIWHKGSKEDGSDSYAEQIKPVSHWPEIIDIIAIVSSEKKKVSSNEGHALTKTTSRLYELRPKIAEKRVKEMLAAIDRKDFEELGRITMRDSDSMHSTMLDSWPPIIYLNDVSKSIMMRIHELNDSEGRIVAAYTFDAGPNAHIITTRQYKKEVIKEIGRIEGVHGLSALSMASSGPMLTKQSLIPEALKNSYL
jgi:diphosphomevalonate decarboxylase